MRHTSEILKELGFNEDAPESTKQALLKHLQRAIEAEKSTASSTKALSESREKTSIQKNSMHNNSAPVQLSFDFNDQTELAEASTEPVPPKRISHR